MANITRYHPFDPAVKKEDIQVDIENDRVSVRVDAKGATAEYKDGVLRLTLPKKTDDSAKRIEVS